MCIAIIKKRGVALPENFKEQCKQSYDSNRDGMGLAYYKDGEKKTYVSKGFFNFDEFWKELEFLEVKPEDSLLVHARISTHGKTDDKNCHPFVVSKKEDECCMVKGFTTKPVIIHNGVFSKYGDRTSDYSDTFHFANKYLTNPGVKEVLKYCPEKFDKSSKDIIILKDGVVTDVTNDFNGKVAILNSNGDINTFGYFLEDGGMLYSNTGYKTYTRNRGGVEDDYHSRAYDVYPKPSPTKEVSATGGVISKHKLMKLTSVEKTALIKKVLMLTEDTRDKYLIMTTSSLDSSIPSIARIPKGSIIIPQMYNEVVNTIRVIIDFKNSYLIPVAALLLQTENFNVFQYNSTDIIKKLGNNWGTQLILDMEKDTLDFINIKKHGVYSKQELRKMIYGWKITHLKDKVVRLVATTRSLNVLRTRGHSYLISNLERHKGKTGTITMPSGAVQDGMVCINLDILPGVKNLHTPIQAHLLDLGIENSKDKLKMLLESKQLNNSCAIN